MADGNFWTSMGVASIQGLNNIANSAFNYANTKKLAAYQNELAIENWNLQNEYNKPVNQMARLQEAGINPNLAYSNGSISNTSSSAPDAHNVADINAFKNPFNFGDSFTTGLQFLSYLLSAQKQKNENEISKYQSFSAYTQALRDWNNLLLDFGGKDVYTSGGDSLKTSLGDLGSFEVSHDSPAYLSRYDSHNIDVEKVKNLWQNTSNLVTKNVLTDKQIESITKDLELKGLKISQQEMSNKLLGETLDIYMKYGEVAKVVAILGGLFNILK